MKEIDKTTLIQLAETYGYREVIQFLKEKQKDSHQLKDVLLEYLYTTSFNNDKKIYVEPLYCEENEQKQIFSNGTTSVFALSKPIIKQSWLDEERKIIVKPVKRVDSSLMEEYINRIKFHFCDGIRPTSFEELEFLCNDLDKFSISELKLLKLLFEDSKLYLSDHTNSVCAHSQMGDAYILGKDKYGKKYL
ncbi:MAG: hypothetical protein E7165_00785 [Firmicutes bacterium]|nr:hypothetical protein [Bacillota bacterium]